MSTAALSAVLDADVTEPSAWRVLVTLADYADDRGRRAFPSVSTLVRRTHLGRATVFRALSQLTDAGLIARGDQDYVAFLPANRRPTVWDLDLTAARATTQGSQVETPEPASGVSQGSHERPFRGLTGETQNLELRTYRNAGARASAPPASVLLDLDRSTGSAVALCAECRQLGSADDAGLTVTHTTPAGGRCPGSGRPPDQLLRPPPGDYATGAQTARAALRPTDERRTR